MPRTSQMMRAEVLSVPAATAVIASAARLPGIAEYGKKRKKVLPPEAWQSEAWQFYDAITEYHYAVTWVSNLLSKAKLVIHENGKPTTNQFALDALASLFGGPEGQSEMLRLFGIHFTVAGEAFLVGVDKSDEMEDDEWMVVPATQIKLAAKNRWKIWEDFYESPYVIRLWRPHPNQIKYPDCPTRAVIPVLSQILGLTDYIAAQIRSRLLGGGLLLIPSDITFATGSTEEGQTQSNSAEAFVAMLTMTMSTAIANQSDPSAYVPIILQAAGEHLDKIKLVEFWTQLQEEVGTMRDKEIARLGTGLDMPPEILTGQGDMNHWSSWQVEEAAIKAHTEPLLAVIVAALNKGYLHPLLVAGDSEGNNAMDAATARTFAIVPDTSQMRLRPNRSAEAIELYDRGVLSADAVIRENGFDPGDRMEKEERKEWLIRKIAGGSTTPELVEAAIAYLGVLLDVKSPADQQGEFPAETQEARPTRSLEEHPRRDPPEPPDALTAAAEVLVYRALERAGNRLKTHLRQKPQPGVPAAQAYQFVQIQPTTVDDLLADAWGMVDQFCYGVDPKALATCLDNYTRGLLVEQQPHDRDLLKKHLDLLERSHV